VEIDLSKQIVAVSMRAIPAQVVKASHLVPQGLLLAAFIIASATFSLSTIAWFSTKVQKTSMHYWCIFGILITIFWALLGVTPSELFLAFLPVSISTNVCFYTFWARASGNPLSCKKLGKAEDQCDKSNSIA
jgi:hypothetical protein